MTVLMSADAFDFLGALIVVSIALHVITLLFVSWRRVILETRRSRVSLELLESEIAARRAHNQLEFERSTLSWNGTRKFEILRKVRESNDVCSFYLVPHDGKLLPPFQPGQYLTFHLKIAGHDKAVIRCYSLSDSPSHPDRYRVTIKAIPPPRDKPESPAGVASNFFHDSLSEGSILDVKAPTGHFHLDLNRYAPVVLIAGGIGITPLLSILLAICESGFKRETWFFYGVRNHREHIMHEFLQELARENANVHLHVCYSDAGPDDRPETDYHHGERVSVDLLRRLLPSNNYEYYVCGPPPMMESITQGLKGWGVPQDRINFEAFGPETVRKAKIKTAVDQQAGEFKIEFSQSGKTLDWDPSAESILEFAEANGIPIDCGCRAGNCGTCLTAIKTGEVTYINEPGETPEEGSCLTCISVPKTSLTLDA